MNIFICCSAKNNISKDIVNDCKNLLELVLKENDLLFGTCVDGIMGLSYQIAKKNNRKVSGLCPELYAGDFAKMNCDEEIITNGILDSTLKIIDRADAIIVLPGGFGTIYEFFTTLYSKICKEHNLPVILYNSCGYYDKLIDFIETMYKEKFAEEEMRDKYFIINTPEEVQSILDKIKN